jgi:hypothetical protein
MYCAAADFLDVVHVCSWFQIFVIGNESFPKTCVLYLIFV